MQSLACSALRIFIPVIILFSGLHAQSPTKYSDSPGEFINELGAFMTATKRPDLEEAFTVFKKNYREGRMNETKMKRVILVANMLAEQRLSQFPYYKDYINAVNAAVLDSDTTLFERWHGFTEQVIGSVERGRTKPIQQFLEFSSDLMANKALKTGEGGSVTWSVKGGTWAFEIRDKIPVLRCENIRLIGSRKQDSIAIAGTSGDYFPFENRWSGTGGKVSWQAAGLDSSVYALLTRYIVETTKPLFQCDTATLYYPLYFKEKPISGKFEDNIVVENKAGGSQFPRFESFDTNLKINKIGDGIEYIGGFLLRGSSLYGYGSREDPARLTMYNKKRQKVFYGTGNLFIIKREVSIHAEEVNAKLFMDADSLYHPTVGLRVDIPKQTIHLARGSKGSERNPFFSSFYNMNLNTDRIAWHLNNDSLEIGERTGLKGLEQKVEFESSNHFDMKDFLKMQMIGEQNPISTLYTLWRETAQDENTTGHFVTDDAFAQRINPKFDHSSIQTLLATLVAEGFINYYFKEHKIELRDKLIHYALASQGKKDYDAIKIESVSTSSNAKLDLKTKETQVFEVKKIELSKRQRVAYIPYDKQMTLLKNRDMRFSGRLFAGLALFEGRDMGFNYEKYQVDFDSVRHLDFYIPTGKINKDGEPEALAINSSIEKVSGALLVDAPNNKAGKNSLDMFPSLQSKKNSFVYYDRKETQEGAYTRDSFYFKLDPFTFNALDSITKSRLRFRGEMFPATIFPNFKETIFVRDEDKSLGFIHQTPEKGYPTYTGKGNYTGKLDLSNKGFLGKGVLEYLTADIESEDLIFKPKQTTGTAKKFFMEEDREGDVRVPQAKGQDVSVNWLPFRDSMYVTSKAKAFELFKQPGYTHKGVLVLTPSGLKGRGVFEWTGGKLTSKQIDYGPFQAGADTADLEIKALSGEGIAFDSKNIDGELDFDAQFGHFKANSADANTTLPLDKYRTSMNEFSWDMKAQTITFKADELKPGVFVSIDPKQDSLKFTGKSAFYDMKTNILKVGGVPYVKTSDAFIYPDSNEVEIQAGGKMSTLKNARIQVDTVTKYHTIDSATVEVKGRDTYTATGYYQYNIPGYNQEVFFNNIVGDEKGERGTGKRILLTTADGDIAEKDSFRMDVKTWFKGKMTLFGNKPNMTFEGYAKLDAEKLPGSAWFTVKSEVDKNNPVFDIRKAKNEADDPIVTAFCLSRETGETYPRILLPSYARIDRRLIDCEGVCKYDAKADRFIFGDSAKIVALAPRGARMTFDNKTGIAQAEGKINLGSGLKYMKIKAAGRLKSDYTTYTDSTGYTVTGEIMSGIEMTIPKPLIDILINDVKASSFSEQTAIYTTQAGFYGPALPEFVSDDKDLPQMTANLPLNIIQIPKKDDKFAFVLGRHSVLWNQEYQSFLSLEERIPVISLFGEPLNKSLSAMVEYKMPGNEDDRFYLYIKASPDLWYFFGYQSGVLNITSSSTRFNDALVALKAKETQIKMPDGEIYEIVAANPSIATAFINRVRTGRTGGGGN